MVSVYGAHLQKQAAEDSHGRSAEAAPSTARYRRVRIAEASLREAKRALRGEMTAARAAYSAMYSDDGAAAAHAVRDRFVAAFAEARPAAAVSGYWPIGGEIDPRPLLQALHDRGWICALPIVEAPGLPLAFRRWRPGEALVAASFGLNEPARDAAPVVPDVVIAPMLAADRAGHRLGYGGGFYDRTIRGLREAGEVNVVAIGYDLQIQPAVPAGDGDAVVDWVLSERRAVRCAANR